MSRQAHLKKAIDRELVSGNVTPDQASVALMAAAKTAGGAKTARQALKTCVDLATDPSRVTPLASLIRQQLGPHTVADPHNRVTWAALLHAAAESAGRQGRAPPELCASRAVRLQSPSLAHLNL
jgi:hypothetical protein